ncbi:MAG: EamA family transporter [Actinomycetota bacterium]|nr:EamA family transporter [Actinomycetota bacterium]
MDRSTRNGIAFALLAALFWGVSGAVAADAFTHLSATRVAEARAIVTTLLFIPFAYFRGALAPRGGLLGFALLGANLVVVNVTFYWAIDRLGVGPGATIQFLAPIFVLLWMVVAQRRHVSPTVWVAAAVAVTGVFLITEAWNLEGGDWIGVAWGLLSAVAFASYLVFGEYLGRSHPAMTIVTWGFVFASVIWLFVQPLWSFPTDLSAKVWFELLWIGIIGTALPFLFGFSALRRAASGIVGVISTTEPVFAATAAWILLGQYLSAVQMIGGVMVLGAAAAIQRWGTTDAGTPVETTE